MDHEMLQIGGVWECPSCPRKLVLTRDNFQVLDQGDFSALHFGTSGPSLSFDPVRIHQE